VEFVAQLVDQMIDRAGRFGLNIKVCVLAEKRQRFPVKDQLDIRKPARARGANLVGRLSVTAPELASPSFWPSWVTSSRFVSYSNEIAFCAAQIV